MPVDFPGYVATQVRQLEKLAAFAQERGYWLFFYPDDRSNGQLPGMISHAAAGALQRMLNDHADTFGRRHPMQVGVRLWTPSMDASRAAGKLVLDDPVTPSERIAVFFCVPNRVKFKPIVGAMSLISQTEELLVQPTRTLFTHHPMSERHEYYGRGKAALAAVLPIFDMPENRALLKG